MIEEARPEGVAGALVATFRSGARALLVGGPPGCFPQVFYRHDRLVTWPSSEAHASDMSRKVPVNVGVILVCDRVSVALQQNVRDQAKALGLVCPPVMSSGAIKRVVTSALDEVNNRLQTQPLALVETPPKLPGAPEPEPEVPFMEDTLIGLEYVRQEYLKLRRELEAEKGRVAELEGQLATARKELEQFAQLKAVLKGLA